MKVSLFRLFSIAVIIAFLTAAFIPQAVVVAVDEPVVKGLAAPTPKSPHGTILDTTPTYKWTVVSGATIYRYQVWQGTTLKLDKSPDSGICGATTCEKSPAFTLGYNTYKWRVKAYKGGVWSTWSAYMNFTISPPGFSSSFNGSLAGWTRMGGGTWINGSSKYLQTGGLPDEWTSAYRTTGQYTNFDYSASIWRYGTDVNYIVFRAGTMTSALESKWYPGYYLGYKNDGYYSIWYMNSIGGSIEIQGWTLSTAVHPNEWNTLRVVAKGSQFWCYINGTLVKSFTDTNRSRGYIGVSSFRSAGTTSYNFYVDWAALTPIETVQ